MFEQSRQNAGGTTQLTNTLVAVFATEHDARAAIKDLHKAGFRKTWLGKILPADRYTGEPVVEEADGAFVKFFSGDPTKQTLYKALLQQGASEEQASAVEQDVAPGCALLTVYGEDNPSKAHELLADNKGHVIGSSAKPTAVDAASLNPRVGVDKHDRGVHDGAAVSDDGATGRVPLDTMTRAYDDYPDARDHASQEFYQNRPSMR